MRKGEVKIMKEPLTFRMYTDIRFNRPINEDTDQWIFPGGPIKQI
jgi:hypothetical protein